MEDLSYFLSLLKHDVLLWTIIKDESFANVNLEDIDHDFWTDQYLQIENYALGDEKFDEVWIMLTDILISISFRSGSSKYLDNTIYYFSDDVVPEDGTSYFIADTKVSNVSKRLGVFDVDPDISINVSVGNSSVYGYYIDVTVYKEGWIDKIKNL